MLILHYSLCFHRTLFFCSSFPPKINQKASVLGIGWSCCKGFVNRRCSSSSLVVCAVDKESDFEVDPVKAREALRELDDQLQSIAQKQIDPPKVRGKLILWNSSCFFPLNLCIPGELMKYCFCSCVFQYSIWVLLDCIENYENIFTQDILC